MIFDSTYTEEEISSRVGWGHSTWQQGLRLAEAAGAKVFCLFHHDPDRDDRTMDGLAAAVDATRAGTIVAREGLVIDLGSVVNKDSSAVEVAIQGFRIEGSLDAEAALLAERCKVEAD